MKSLWILLFVCFSQFVKAQSDTSFVYLAQDGRGTTKDSAVNFVKLYRSGTVWHGKEYYAKTGVLRSEGDYAENNVKTQTGEFSYFTEQGKPDYTGKFVDGRLKEQSSFYKNGTKRSWATFDDKGVVFQKGWDESGKEIKNYIVTRLAKFKGGLEGWKRYLGKNMNSNPAIDAGVAPGQYQVVLSFTIAADGYPCKVKVVSATEGCKICVAESLNVIRNSDKWEPAIRNNEPVEMNTVQPITWMVPERKAKK